MPEKHEIRRWMRAPTKRKARTWVRNWTSRLKLQQMIRIDKTVGNIGAQDNARVRYNKITEDIQYSGLAQSNLDMLPRGGTTKLGEEYVSQGPQESA